MLQIVQRPRAVEIPLISDKRLAELSTIICPVVSMTTLPKGHYPTEIVQTFRLCHPSDLREDNFLQQRRRFFFSRVRLVEEARILTLHPPGNFGGRIFHPTIAEVLAQIPARYLHPTNPPGSRIVAFETFQEAGKSMWDRSGRFHVATTVLLTKGSRARWYSPFH